MSIATMETTPALTSAVDFLNSPTFNLSPDKLLPQKHVREERSRTANVSEQVSKSAWHVNVPPPSA